MIEFPALIGLCPVHGHEFYMPLSEGEDHTCPMTSCREAMTIYVKQQADQPWAPLGTYKVGDRLTLADGTEVVIEATGP